MDDYVVVLIFVCLLYPSSGFNCLKIQYIIVRVHFLQILGGCPFLRNRYSTEGLQPRWRHSRPCSRQQLYIYLSFGTLGPISILRTPRCRKTKSVTH